MQIDDELEMLRLATIAVDSALAYSSGDVLIDRAFYCDARVIVLEALNRQGDFMPGQFQIVNAQGVCEPGGPLSLFAATLELINRVHRSEPAEHWIVRVAR